MYRFILFIFLIFTQLTLAGQGYLKASGQQIVDAAGEPIILRGMGLGGWMLQEGYMLQTADFANSQRKIRQHIASVIGEEDTELFYEAWWANHVRKIDIDSLGSWGFNSVRLPMHYNLFTLPIEDEPIDGQNTWLEKGFTMTDSLISWCKQNQMYVILDLHATPGGQGYDEGISDYDPSKPSLWESEANRAKTVALWKRLAERYVDEPWVAGYDLINEPNWNIDGNVLLKDLYVDITNAIRSVDNNHILFIEGNWFANDFTNLTPPWDDNMVYSPHKYWSINDQASIQWVLDIREQFDVPIYFGESGENSNGWFRDAIRLLEDRGIGWAWWPMKKIESIAGPYSVVKTAGYQALLNFWKGSGLAPTPAQAKATLMQLTEDLKLENCRYQKDVIDAMFRQVSSDDTKPYEQHTIPGLIYASDFDMGVVGSAYHDLEVANFQVSTGNYTSWNNGWTYRNDGVDLESSTDHIKSNGVNVGWFDKDEWIQYTVHVDSSAIYDIHMRVASNTDDAKFHLTNGKANISGSVEVAGTGGWQVWKTVTVPNVVLTPEDDAFRIYMDEATFNLGSFEFVKKGSTDEISTSFLSALTSSESSINLYLNKPLQGLNSEDSGLFEILVNGDIVTITGVNFDPDNPRLITFTTDRKINAREAIKISYNGTTIQAGDGTSLAAFVQRNVTNNIALIHPVPGRIEVEDYFFQSGVQLENTTDAGGGQNIGFLDPGDYLDYYINVSVKGIYELDFRTAALSETGAVQIQLIGPDESVTILGNVSFSPTGGWQTWTTTSMTVALPEGEHHLRIVIQQPLFNINWMTLSLLTNTTDLSEGPPFRLFPNPTRGEFFIEVDMSESMEFFVQVFDVNGRMVIRRRVARSSNLKPSISLSPFPEGVYLVRVHNGQGLTYQKKIIKINH